MMKRFLPYLILLSALSVSGSAAFYSVYGLSKLFAGASLQVVIMASSLEVAKLVIATLLHRYWSSINRLLKIYLTIATVVLVLITSAGIYGFLSNAYQLTANQDKIVTRGIELVDTKQNIYEQSKLEYTAEKETIVNSISELRKSLANPGQVQFVDKKSGKVVTSTSNNSQVRKSLEIQLNDAIQRRDELTKQIQISSDSIGKFEIEKIELENNSDAAAELGPLKYISALTGITMDRIVNYFLLLIIFVFDPLAIALVLASSFAFSQMKHEVEIEEEKKRKTEIRDAELKEQERIQSLPAVENIYNTIQKKKQNPNRILKERRIVKIESDGDIVTEEVPELSPNQIKNMSHEAVERYLKSRNTT